MKLKLVVLSLFFLFQGCVSWCEDPVLRTFTLENVGDVSSVFQIREDVFSSYFAENIQNFERDGLYLFWESKGSRKMFFIPDSMVNVVEAYAIPEVEKSPFLEPEEYLQKRQNLLKDNYRNPKCMEVKTVPESIVVDLVSLQLQYRSFLTDEKMYDMQSRTLLGFYKSKEEKGYFFFREPLKDQPYWNKAFDVYYTIFEKMDALDKVFDLGKCR